ncbi:MAG TPA: hypothetical protein VIJ15_02530 [Dermatophilaceae bacterium]
MTQLLPTSETDRTSAAPTTRARRNRPLTIVHTGMMTGTGCLAFWKRPGPMALIA